MTALGQCKSAVPAQPWFRIAPSGVERLEGAGIPAHMSTANPALVHLPPHPSRKLPHSDPSGTHDLSQSAQLQHCMQNGFYVCKSLCKEPLLWFIHFPFHRKWGESCKLDLLALLRLHLTFHHGMQGHLRCLGTVCLLQVLTRPTLAPCAFRCILEPIKRP